MRDAFVYLPAGIEPYLLHGWIARQPADRRLWLIGCREEAGAIAETSKRTMRWDIPGPDDDLSNELRDAMGALESACLTIPVSVDQIPMRYRPGALMADVAPHYGLLRQAWHWGFREVCFTSGNSETRIALPHLLDEVLDRHRGQRCFVVGNGPSLQQLDMPRLRDEITLGSNRCFLGYETWGFPFTYWGVYDKYQIETYHPVYETHVPHETTKFYPVEYASVLNVANGCPVNCVWPRQHARDFSADPGEVYVGFTVTYMLLQIAAVMGCDPIILIGADHRYELSRRGYHRLARQARRRVTRSLRGGRLYESVLAAQRAWKKHSRNPGDAPALWSTDDAREPTHFTSAYTDGGRNKFLPPEPEEAERDFDEAEAWARRNGREILNATPGTALESFPKVAFDDLF